MSKNESICKKESELNTEGQTSRLIPCVEWPKYHPWPPIGGLRHLIFHEKSNGFNKVIKRVGRRVLIDEKKFFEFVDQLNSKKDLQA